jgi:hypothetical protein
MPDPTKEAVSKPSPYIALGETDSAFQTIEETLTKMISQKAFEKQKNELTMFLSQMATMRPSVVGLYATKFAAYEAGRLKKINTPAAQ